MVASFFHIIMVQKNIKSSLIVRGKDFIYETVNKNYIKLGCIFCLKLPMIFIEFNRSGININLEEYFKTLKALRKLFFPKKSDIDFVILLKNNMEIISIFLSVTISLIFINEIFKSIKNIFYKFLKNSED